MGEPDEPAAAAEPDESASAAARDRAEPKRARQPGLSPVAILAALLGLGIPVLAIMVAYQSCTDTTVRGGVSVRGGGPDWRRTIDGCTADPVALEVMLTAGDTAMVRVLVDPIDGPRAELARPGGPPLVLTAATCPGLHVHVRAAGKRADDSPLLDGAVNAACRIGDARIDLDAWWRSCHPHDPDE